MNILVEAEMRYMTPSKPHPVLPKFMPGALKPLRVPLRVGATLQRGRKTLSRGRGQWAGGWWEAGEGRQRQTEAGRSLSTQVKFLAATWWNHL